MCKKAVFSIYLNLKFSEQIILNNYDIELHIVRHGEDDANKIGGWSDNHLTKKGQDEIYNLLSQIETYDLFVSSDLQRAKETSEIINKKLNMNIIYNSNFREVNNGDLKNVSIEEFKKINYKKSFSNLEMNESYPNGESPLIFYERITNEFIKLTKHNIHKKILLVTHGEVINVILCLINGYQYSNKIKIAPQTGSIIKLK